jgi:hypothetical protein
LGLIPRKVFIIAKIVIEDSRLTEAYVNTHDERVRPSFSKQAFMSTLGAELTAVVEGGVEIRLPFSPSLTQQNGTCTRALLQQCWILLAVTLP